MSASKKLARVTVTIPADVLRSADAQAKRERRSRSWIVSEALRRYAQEGGGDPRHTAAVHEPVVAPYASGLGESRIAQLESDLRLTPEQRVHEAEETTEALLAARPQPRIRQVVYFASWEDYLAWKRKDGLA